ncbi:RICIN domain-containing protein [Streptomyces adelaidensis]|uniref:RICIN domain-containing protein n=1 Tax=Streptomyces adelaidensis TaxID=2796465 RepID=UPI0019078450|nr:RICIN domain-containing protein [Streptomyces adelaidensis]
MARARDERPDDDTSGDETGGTGTGGSDIRGDGIRGSGVRGDGQDIGTSGTRPGDPSDYRTADASDARLTALLRADTNAAYPALRELRERHHPAVLAYARLCAASESAARQLAAEAFTVATRETARGTETPVPWRHHLLLLTARAAAAWTGDEHAAGLDPALLVALNTAGPEGLVAPLLAAFESLPARDQGLIWYGVVEREPDDRTALLLGLTRDDVTYKQAAALHTLRRSCLAVRLAASGDPRCQDFRRLIEESVRPDNPRHSTDLQSHMAHCAHCTGAYEELRALRDNPRATLAEWLLPWGGTAYVRGETGGRGGARGGVRGSVGPGARVQAGAWEAFSEPEFGAGAGAGADTRGGAPAAGRAPRPRLLVLTSVVLGVALVPLVALLVFRGGSSSPESPDAAGAAATPSGPPSATSSATVPSSPAPSPTASSTERPSKPEKPTKKPTKSPSPSPTPSKSVLPTTPSLPNGPPLNGGYHQVVNVASGLCLDIRGELANGTDVVTAICSSRDTQRWRVDADGDALQSFADPDLCLDSRGATDDGVGVRECDALDGDNGENLRFTFDSEGAIHPRIAPDHAVTPDAHGSVGFTETTGRAGQRWRAGAGPVRT